MKIIQKDMLTIQEGILFHQTNCQGVMGGGIALAFARRWPELEKHYRAMCELHSFNAKSLLGKVFLYKAETNLYIANVFGQDDISRSERMTSYDATAIAFEKVRRSMDKSPIFTFSKFADRLYFPFKMGCGLGGGDWQIYSAIIDRYFPDAIICQHG